MNNYLPRVDSAVSALFDDLYQSGLIEKTLVIMCGEFGRTPRMNTGHGQGTPGRDHWGRSMFVLMGVLAETSGMTRQVFYAADLWLRRFKGGLYQAVIVGSAMFESPTMTWRRRYFSRSAWGSSRVLMIGRLTIVSSATSVSKKSARWESW